MTSTSRTKAKMGARKRPLSANLRAWIKRMRHKLSPRTAFEFHKAEFIKSIDVMIVETLNKRGEFAMDFWKLGEVLALTTAKSRGVVTNTMENTQAVIRRFDEELKLLHDKKVLIHKIEYRKGADAKTILTILNKENGRQATGVDDEVVGKAK